MRATLHRLADDWERTALWVIFLACVLCSLAWLLAPAPASAPLVTANPRPRPSILGPHALAFLSPPQSQVQIGSAFGFSCEMPGRATGYVPVDPDPGPGPTTGPTTGTTTGPEVDGDIVIDTPPPQEPSVPVATTRAVRYLGTYESTNGQRLAALAVRDPKTGNVQTRFLRPGQTYGQFRVRSFDAESLRVLAPNGTRATVPRGAERTVTMD